MQYSYSELLGMVEVLSDAGCSIARRVAISDVFASLQDSRALWVLDRVVEMNAEIIGRFNTASMLYTFTQNLFERYCCETAGCGRRDQQYHDLVHMCESRTVDLRKIAAEVIREYDLGIMVTRDCLEELCAEQD